jgi:hypothetical protein
VRVRCPILSQRTPNSTPTPRMSTLRYRSQ